MYLKSIEVQGFKSFANKIVFKFHNGITGIVGPNGSGKSNVGDAVRWVLGEQSAKQLRGANMQDVIFSGTENRKPLGFASVAITLDNSDHQLPVDYNEVTVTRRVYRSGESEYLMNGASCRLKDINELFYDTGIGKEGYSIIGQGQIDKILSGKPEERRELFDEAAGIVKFKRRKKTAQKKLEDEKQNLQRINDILSELTRQLGPLERQAETARQYLKKKEELKSLDVNMFLLEMERIKTQINEVLEKLSISDSDLADTKESYESTRTEYEKLESNMEELDRRIEEVREKANQNQLLKQQLEGDINVLREQINTAKLNEEHLQNRKDAIQTELESKSAQKEKENLELEQLRSQLLKAAEEEEDAKLEADAISANLSHIEAQVERNKNKIIELLNQRASTKAKLQRQDTMLEQIQIRKAKLGQRALKLKSEDVQQKETLKKLQRQYQEVLEVIAKRSEEVAAYEQKERQLQQELTSQNQQLETGQTAYHREASRLESLKNITERYDGYGNSIRRIMEQKAKEKGIVGVVADIVKTEKTYETAIETALGGSIQNIVTEDSDTAKRMIEFLKRNKYGRATFLPLTDIGNKNGFINDNVLKEPGIIGLASQLVQADAEYEGLVKYLLGKTVVARHIDHAIALAKKYRYSLRIVTLEGESLSPGGSMTGGAFKNSSNLLGRRREIEELKQSVALLLKDMEILQKSIDENRKERNLYRDKMAELNENIQKKYLIQNTLNMEIDQTENKIEELEKGFHHLKRETSENESQMVQICGEQKEIQQELDTSMQREKELESSTNELQKTLEEERREQEEQTTKSGAIHLELANLKQKEEFIDQTLKRIHGEIQSLREEMETVQSRITGGGKEEEKKLHEIAAIEKNIEKAKQYEIASDKTIQKLLAEKEELNTSHKTFFTKREELSERISILDKECFRLNSQKERLLENKEVHINYMWEEYELTGSSAAKLRNPELDNPADLKKNINRLKEEIKELGNVNVNAIDDFKELSQRHFFLSIQQEDLAKAEQVLLDIIAELDAGMRAQFKENFAVIQTEFDKAFKQLFGGGKGSLELVEDEDVLEAGIRIISQPPGKKLQNMMQLSGGEKALTAIALLFGIQKLKPSPFCLLDEIEAALDESNVTRFANYLRKLTKHTQFIIITHRRGTMAAADRLYGITMQEKGISALVSVNLIEDDLE